MTNTPAERELLAFVVGLCTARDDEDLVRDLPRTGGRPDGAGTGRRRGRPARDAAGETSPEVNRTERQENDMTDEQTTQDQAEETTEVPQETPAEVETEREIEETEQGGKGNREAARYRKQLRETETERDQLRGQVDAMQRAEVERLAGDVLSKPSGLWAAGVQVADLRADDGTIDQAKVTAAAKQAANDLGLARPSRNYVPREGANPITGGGRSMVDTVMGRDQ